jgi:hypothetical protein
MKQRQMEERVLTNNSWATEAAQLSLMTLTVAATQR